MKLLVTGSDVVELRTMHAYACLLEPFDGHRSRNADTELDRLISGNVDTHHIISRDLPLHALQLTKSGLFAHLPTTVYRTLQIDGLGVMALKSRHNSQSKRKFMFHMPFFLHSTAVNPLVVISYRARQGCLITFWVEARQAKVRRNRFFVRTKLQLRILLDHLNHTHNLLHKTRH